MDVFHQFGQVKFGHSHCLFIEIAFIVLPTNNNVL